MSEYQTYQNARRFAVAPMLAYTNRHTRFFYRLLSHSALLHTEMIHARVALGKHSESELGFSSKEHPLAVQLAGNDIGEIVEAGLLCQQRGFDAINLNIGCPSNKVRHGEFGACLMLKPQLVADQVAALTAKLQIPVSVKCRLGVDQQDYHQTLPIFLHRLYHAGCREVVIHARKAMLAGLNPKQNRDLPPLDYEFVYQMKQRYSDMFISINGGVGNLDEANQHLNRVDGVMLGRAVITRPTLLTEVDSLVFGAPPKNLDLIDLLCGDYAAYLSEQSDLGVAAPPLLRPVINLFKSKPGGGNFRRVLSQAHASRLSLGEMLQNALQEVSKNSQTKLQLETL